MLRRAIRWFKALLRWLAEPRLVWFLLLVLGAALFFSFRPGASELQIRLTGLILQWFGIFVVARDLYQTRKLFGHPSTVGLLRKWLGRFPRWRPQIVAGVGNVRSRASTFAGHAYGWHRMDVAGPADKVIGAVVRNVEGLNDRLLQLQTELDTESRSQVKALRQEQEFRATEDQLLGERLEVAQTAGFTGASSALSGCF